MQKNIYLIRHGETDFNKNGYFQGQGLNPPLNENGLLQAKNMSQELKNTDIDIVYTSSLIRAHQTAEILAESKDIPLVTDDRILEAKMGVAEGKLKQYVTENMSEAYKQWRDLSNWDFAFDGGETRRQILSRFINFIDDIAKNEYKNIAVITHAGVIRAFWASQGINQTQITNAGITHCLCEDGILSIVKKK